MRRELALLRDEYLSLKNSKARVLDMAQLKRVVKFRVKLKKLIKKLELMIKSLEAASEYGSDLRIIKKRLSSELDALKLMKETF